MKTSTWLLALSVLLIGCQKPGESPKPAPAQSAPVPAEEAHFMTETPPAPPPPPPPAEGTEAAPGN